VVQSLDGTPRLLDQWRYSIEYYSPVYGPELEEDIGGYVPVG
jgi:hypothetical protein